MNKIKCECGHINPEGTVLCEACGKPVEENQHIDGNNKSKLLNMRYDGSARRSKTYNKTIVDKIWNFFSSVKVGVWLIAITLIASSIGTIFPQAMNNQSPLPPEQYYEQNYGMAGQIYYQLGFHDLYGSWWYMILIASIGVSLVICSIDRVVPLYRALKKQKPKRHETFLKRQRVFGEAEDASNEDYHSIVENLKKRRYKVTEENGHVLAEKGRFSRWGPYVNHIGLIIFLLGALLRFVPSMYVDANVWVREGETKMLEGTEGEYYIKNEDFIVEMYDEDDERYKEAIKKQGGAVPKNYQTNAVLYERTDEALPGVDPELKEVKNGEIRVNEPLKINGYAIYQTTYQLNEFKTMTFKLHERNDPEEKSLGEFTVDLVDPEPEYTLDNGYRVELYDYYPEFEMKDGVPSSFSKYPKDPAFVFHVYPPGEDEPEVNFLAIGSNLDPGGENQYKLGIADLEVRDVTGLTIRKDYTLPLLGIGGAIFMIGVIQGMYWNHRRIWIHRREKGFWIAGHTNKNWFGLKKDIEKVLDGTNVKEPEDQQELKEEPHNGSKGKEE
ncbi:MULTISPECIES: cytochrome c biogenesis protein ResB [Pontibacillus]|uniref:Cytochrome c biogenesis protein ResB n=1 Tax=Pontibacillus chungwhensis TaxID=265426 RepID=A0ABY8UVB2_9BACI|nr:MULTISPECIES: cytochrome c biogenesis protein ResB [Pontibacillus]MCD5323041.1 cytochrome c biogenesis protein ResB [Pontibacillus sp. HN14]WIF96434.1 cytochrome c biogenesis protein ResB [Pontibacillus chungwhensis]